MLSVVVVPFGGPQALARCLNALARQTGSIDTEIIVPIDDGATHDSALIRQFPDVRFERLSGRHTFAELRAIGVRESQGEIVAITEAQCPPDQQWCEQIVAAHAAPHAAIGGVVEKVRGNLTSWSMYFCDYSRYMSPVCQGPAHCLTDCNVSYKRRVLEDISDVWSSEFHEPSVHWALEAQRATLWLSKDIEVVHERDMKIGAALLERYQFGRLFASTRVAAVTRVQRWLLASASWVLPALLVTRVAKTVIVKRRHVMKFVQSIPHLLILATAWVVGEFTGYVTGTAGPALTPAMGSPARRRTRELEKAT